MNTTRVQIQGCTVKFSNGQSVSFDTSVDEMIQFDNVLVVRLRLEPGLKTNENVFGIDFNGIVLWQVPEKPHVRHWSPYTGLKKEDNNVVLYNTDGLYITLEPNSGDILKEYRGK